MVRSPEGRDAFKLRLNEKSPDAETESVLDKHQVTSLLSYTKYTSLFTSKIEKDSYLCDLGSRYWVFFLDFQTNPLTKMKSQDATSPRSQSLNRYPLTHVSSSYRSAILIQMIQTIENT